jgi:HD-GYP domain-containing protein (c-di-GMP phosphodiesterase class II)
MHPAAFAAVVGPSSAPDLSWEDRDPFQPVWLGSVVRSLMAAMDVKDAYTKRHCERVARISWVLAAQTGCNRSTLKTVYLSGLLHDIGKIGLDDSVLRTARPLTEPEWQQVKQHPEWGCQILSAVEALADALPVIRHHHERWDGQGYPDGLKGVEIPPLARICAVADAVDAMASDRSYRPGRREAEVTDLIRQGSGHQWDPDVVTAYLQSRDELGALLGQEQTEQRDPTSDRVASPHAGWMRGTAPLSGYPW